MLPFLGNDSRYSLTAGEVHQLPLGRRLGVSSISPHDVALAFVGRDQSWCGARTMSVNDSIHRGGLTITLVAIGKNRLGRPVAEFEILACPNAVVASAGSASPVSPVSPASASTEDSSSATA